MSGVTVYVTTPCGFVESVFLNLYRGCNGLHHHKAVGFCLAAVHWYLCAPGTVSDRASNIMQLLEARDALSGRATCTLISKVALGTETRIQAQTGSLGPTDHVSVFHRE